jgi:hypothetical protein
MPRPTLTLDEILLARVRVVFYGLHRENCHAVAQAGLVAVDPSSRVPGAKNLLHELIHVRRPLWSETRVRACESRLWSESTWQQKGELYRMLGRAKVWNGEEVFGELPGSAKLEGEV